MCPLVSSNCLVKGNQLYKGQSQKVETVKVEFCDLVSSGNQVLLIWKPGKAEWWENLPILSCCLSQNFIKDHFAFHLLLWSQDGSVSELCCGSNLT